MDSVAIRTKQDPPHTIHAPDHDTFTDGENKPLEVKCPECEAVYSLGFNRIYGPDKSFKVLSEELMNILRSDHRQLRQAAHQSAIPLP
jgi:hypothetical protein